MLKLGRYEFLADSAFVIFCDGLWIGPVVGRLLFLGWMPWFSNFMKKVSLPSWVVAEVKLFLWHWPFQRLGTRVLFVICPILHTLCFNMTIPSNAPPCVSNDPPLTQLHITCALCCCIFALILLVLGWKECFVRVLNLTLVDAPCGECIISYQLGRYFLSEISLFCLFKLMGVVPQGWWT